MEEVDSVAAFCRGYIMGLRQHGVSYPDAVHRLRMLWPARGEFGPDEHLPKELLEGITEEESAQRAKNIERARGHHR